MKVFCPILGFSITKKEVCLASCNHPLCRRCRDRKEDRVFSLTPAGRKVRKRCQRCRERFLPAGNHQKFCERCGKHNETLKNRQRQARFRKKQKSGLGVF
jgi:hypothetical protein